MINITVQLRVDAVAFLTIAAGACFFVGMGFSYNYYRNKVTEG